MITWGQGITSIVGGHLTYEGYYLLSATGMDRNHVKNIKTQSLVAQECPWSVFSQATLRYVIRCCAATPPHTSIDYRCGFVFGSSVSSRK